MKPKIYPAVMFKTAKLWINTLGNKKIYIRFPFDFKTVAFVKKIPFVTYKPEGKYWIAPLNVDTIEMLLQGGFQIDSHLRKFLDNAKRRIEDLPHIEIPGLKGKLKRYQNMAVAFCEMRGSAIIADDMGLGKRQPVSSKVLTPNGWCSIGSLIPGDIITNSNGTNTKVLKVFPQEETDIWEITFSDGCKVKCGPDHLWTVRDANRKKRGTGWVTKTIRELHQMGLSYKGGASKFEIPQFPGLKETNGDSIPINPWLLGQILANGHVSTKRRSIEVVCNGDDIDVIHRLCALGGSTPVKKDGNCFCIRFTVESNLHLYETIEQLDLRKKSKRKFIPAAFLFAPWAERVQLLRGLMDADGCSLKNRISYSSCSKQLAYGVAELVRSLGGCAIIGTYDRRDAEKPIEYRVNVKTQFCPFFSKRKKQNWKPDWRMRGNKIVSVKPVEDEKCVCILVDSPDHLYVTNHYKLTHNTMEAIGFMQLHKNDSPRIIVTVAGAKINWAREIQKWMDGPKIQILSGTKPYPIAGDTIIINYNIIQNWVEPLRALNPKVLILDECHKIKNDSALRTKAIKLLAKKIAYKIPMTGTLIENSPADVFNAVKIVDPNLFPSKYEFLQRYCNPEYNGFGWKYNGVSNAKELFEKLKTVMIRRLVTDVRTELQGKIYNVVPLEIDNEKEYREAETDFVNYLKSGVEKELRESLGKMIRESNGLLELNDFKLERLKEERADKANPLTQMEKLKQLAVKGILEGVYEWLDDFIETGNKILVSTSHQFVIDALMLRYKKVALKIDGSVPSAKRQGIVDIFQTDKQYKILFGNIVAMAEALNITAANYVAHIEHPWNPMTKDQFEARAYRIGQTKPVFVYNFVGINTINEKIIKVLDEKRKISDAVIDGIDTPAKNLIYEVYKSYL